MHLATDNTATEEAGRSSLSVSRSSVSMGLQRLRQCPRQALRSTPIVLPTPERVKWGKGTAPVLSCRIPFLLASNQLHAPVCKLLNLGASSKSFPRCSYMYASFFFFFFFGFGRWFKSFPREGGGFPQRGVGGGKGFPIFFLWGFLRGFSALSFT